MPIPTSHTSYFLPTPAARIYTTVVTWPSTPTRIKHRGDNAGGNCIGTGFEDPFLSSPALTQYVCYYVYVLSSEIPLCCTSLIAQRCVVLLRQSLSCRSIYVYIYIYIAYIGSYTHTHTHTWPRHRYFRSAAKRRARQLRTDQVCNTPFPRPKAVPIQLNGELYYILFTR